MSVHSWQICVKKMCISEGISYMHQIQRTYTKVLHEIYPNVTKFFPVFFYFIFFSNNFRFASYKYVTFGFLKGHRPTYLIVISIDDLAPNRPQIGIWYGILTWINQLTAIDLNMLARICRQQCILFVFCYLYVLYLRDSTLMFIYHRHIFVSYIIQQNNPVSKSLRYILPWFLRNRSYRRRAPSYHRHPINLPSSAIWDKFAYRRLAANLSGIIVLKREKVRVCRFGARRTMPPCFSVLNLREIGGRRETRAGKNFSKRAAASAPSWRR